ncbi:MAG: hypothetical protein Q9166_005195 [cf. Caloplaca sp. 2 TL-2023]
MRTNVLTLTALLALLNSIHTVFALPKDPVPLEWVRPRVYLVFFDAPTCSNHELSDGPIRLESECQKFTAKSNFMAIGWPANHKTITLYSDDKCKDVLKVYSTPSGRMYPPNGPESCVHVKEELKMPPKSARETT